LRSGYSKGYCIMERTSGSAWTPRTINPSEAPGVEDASVAAGPAARRAPLADSSKLGGLPKRARTGPTGGAPAKPDDAETASADRPLTLLGRHEAALRHANENGGIEHVTGVAVALQTLDTSRSEAVPPLMLSFSESALRGAREAAPELQRVLNVETGKLPSDWIDRLHSLGCVAIDLDHTDISPEIIKTAHEGGFRIMCYTVNDLDRMRQLFSWGIDSVVTDMIHEIAPDACLRWDKKAGTGSDGTPQDAYDLPPWHCPELVAHRFSGKTEPREFRIAPENTLAGARETVRYGYRAAEYDVNITTDPVPVPFAMHDETLQRTTDGSGPSARPWSELALLHAGSRHSQKYADEPIPTDLELATYLVRHGVQRLVEIKPMPD
jgi:glycerophosphoryl diester phosphodiesterase